MRVVSLFGLLVGAHICSAFTDLSEPQWVIINPSPECEQQTACLNSLADCIPVPEAMFQEPPQILRLAINRHPRVKFAGVRNVQILHQGRMQTFSQRVIRDGNNLRIEYPADSPFFGQIIVERGPVRLHYIPGQQEIVQQPAREDEALNRLLHAMNARVLVRVSSGQSVAGRQTDLVILDREPGIQFRLWIDRQQGAILRREVIERGGRRVGFYEYQSIDFNARIPRDAFQIDVSGVRTVTVEQQLQRLAERLQIRPYRIASNQWALAGVNHMQLKQDGPRGTDIRVLMSTYANNWRRVSLFQYRGSVDVRRLATLLEPHLKSHVWSRDGYTFVLLGELSEQDLQRLSGTLRG